MFGERGLDYVVESIHILYGETEGEQCMMHFTLTSSVFISQNKFSR